MNNFVSISSIIEEFNLLDFDKQTDILYAHTSLHEVSNLKKDDVFAILMGYEKHGDTNYKKINKEEFMKKNKILL